MKKQHIAIGLKNLKNRKLRTYLTMLGIIIGIAAVVGLISLGDGLQAGVENQFQELGADKILISSSGQTFSVDRSESTLTTDDADALRNVRDVREVGYVNYRVATVEWGREDIGFYPAVSLETDSSFSMVAQTLGLSVEEGRTLRPGDNNRVVVGYDYANNPNFDTNLRIRNTITINNVNFEVVGINQRLGNEIDDRSIFMTTEGFERIFRVGDQVSNIFVQVQRGAQPSDVVVFVEDALRDKKNEKVGEESFEVETFENVIGSFLELFFVIQAVIIGIAAISLLVGGIGIMNTMYTSVLERTKEIGTMKSIGAKNSDVFSIFLFESGLLGLVGGAIGISIGLIFAKSVEIIANDAIGVEFLIVNMSPVLIIGALVFSFLLGILSGYLPSKQAANLNPVDALRSE